MRRTLGNERDPLFLTRVKEALEARFPRVGFRYLATDAPFDLATPLTTAPSSVRCVSAHRRAEGRRTGRFETDCRVDAEWRGGTGGTLRVNHLNVRDSSLAYDVVLELEAS